MADAINGIKKPVQPVKDVSIDWKGCTAEEIIDYKGQGQDVPQEFLQWAQDMAKIQGAPDDITYEMALGKADGTTETNSNLNEAQALREQMGQDGLNLKEQGKIFIAESKDKETSTLSSIEAMAMLINRSSEINKNAEEEANITKTRLQEITDEINFLIEENKNSTDFNNRSEKKGNIQGLQGVAAALANASEAKLNGMSVELDDIEGTINTGASVSQTADEFGQETVDIGGQLLGQAKGAVKKGLIGGAASGILVVGGLLGGLLVGGITGLLFGREKRKIGKEAVEQGTQTITTAEQGAKIAKEAAEENGVSITNVDKKVTEAKETSKMNNDIANGNNQNNSQTDETAEQSIAQTDIPVTTDPDEILKRKERRGIV